MRLMGPIPGSYHLALLLGISLFDQTKLLPRGVPPCLIVGKQMVTAICRGAHQIHGLLAKLIAAQRHVVAVAERLPLSADGTSTKAEAEQGYVGGFPHRKTSLRSQQARKAYGSWTGGNPSRSRADQVRRIQDGKRSVWRQGKVRPAAQVARGTRCCTAAATAPNRSPRQASGKRSPTHRRPSMRIRRVPISRELLL
jgi:hypothetical protein